MATILNTAFFLILWLTFVSAAHEVTGASTPGTGKNGISQTDSITTTPGPSDITSPPQLPPMGKWMYQKNGQKAHWLGVKWEGKYLVEPINIILVDSVSPTADDAVKRLLDNLKRAGFAEKKHHSCGYIGYIGGRAFHQFPKEKYRAFSDRVAELDNNHGRVFGPYCRKGAYIFTGAFSRELFVPTAKIEHRYGSFDRARDELSQGLNKRSSCKIVGFVNLENAIVNNTDTTTGDHDGCAVVLSVTR
jgi:hypothetical protein